MIVTCGGPINTQDFAHTIILTHWWIISRRFGLWITTFADLIFGCHSTSNLQHIWQNNFSLPNRYLPRLCTHLEGTHPLLFPEFQLMNPIFGSTALITVDHPSKPQSTITITTHSNHSPITTNPQPKHIPMPPSARIHQHIGPSMWILGLAVFRSRV